MCTLAQVARCLSHAQIWGDPNLKITGVCTDSRLVRPGNLFVALKGERFDAHTFLPQVQQAGALAALVSDYDDNLPLAQIQVADTRHALGEFALGWRGQFALPVAAVTGSNGKTTVKEMIAAIFSAAVGVSDCLATQGNYNNDIGLPLTLLRLRPHHRLAVIELGMNHPGETALLARIARPTVAVINNAQREHQEFMVNVAAVAQEHSAVLSALSTEGVAVFPADSEYSALWRNYASHCTIIDFALRGEAAVRGDYAALAPYSHAIQDAQSLLIQTSQGEIAVTLHALGEHNARNALAACAVALGAGVDLAAIKLGLDTFRPMQGRLQIKKNKYGTVIDDSYNANPDSVRAAIDVLSTMSAPRLLVLGDMGEVGEQGVEFHREVGAYAKAKGITRLVGVGTLTQYACHAFGDAEHFANTASVCEAIQANALQFSGTVLIKGSRFMRMEQVVSSFAQQMADKNCDDSSNQERSCY
ncbi:MAG: UDP-N-acetylmuramoyl-tripeptide--D-alanyl-D-alanine ligase [Ottowia sp.]|nr:UDP-N-acetylmuramoyl-tripeptide--D-alanyl-D-alanine ligase [Ottowia sp.]